MEKCVLYERTRDGFQMVLVDKIGSWFEYDQRFKAQLAEAGVLEGRDYYQDTSGKYIDYARPLIVKGITRSAYVLIKMSNMDMIHSPLYKKPAGRKVSYAIEAARNVADISKTELLEGEEIYLDDVDKYLVELLRTTITSEIHARFAPTSVIIQLNQDLERIARMPSSDFFYNPRFALAYCSVYKAICEERRLNTTRTSFDTSAFTANRLVEKYVKFMGGLLSRVFFKVRRVRG